MENKIDGVTNLACDIMKASSLPIELSGAIATELYNAGYRKVEQGEWKWVEYGETDIEQYWKCSICGEHSYYQTNYCEHCGSQMKGE